MGGQLLYLGRNTNVMLCEELCVVHLWAAGDIVHWKILVLLCFASFVFHRTCGNEC